MADCTKASWLVILPECQEVLWGRGEGKKFSNTFSLLSEHDIVRIHGEKWAPWIAAIRTRIKVEKLREIRYNSGRKIGVRARSAKSPREKEESMLRKYENFHQTHVRDFDNRGTGRLYFENNYILFLQMVI